MFDVILAMTKECGIGLEGTIPWECKEELGLFKKKTTGNILIIGRKTAMTLPPLKDRTIIVLSTSENIKQIHDQVNINISSVFSSIYDVLSFYKGCNDKKIFIAGGSQLYNEIFSSWKHLINNVHLSIMNDDVKCDTFVKFNPSEWTIKTRTIYNDFTHYVLSPEISGESNYLNLLNDVYTNGWIKKGRNGNTKSMFGKTLEFDLTKGFPLLTTKKMFFRGVVEELLFFIRGNTDSRILEDKKINIWKGNTNRQFLDSVGKNEYRDGIMGPMYGYQWRHYNAPYNINTSGPCEKGLDQLVDVIDKIRNDPHSRRILLTDFNPLQAKEGVLYPCHSIIIQFYVCEGFLDIFCYNRSSDLFHGLPFNIASTALFQTFIAAITGLTARKFVLSLGDVHIYESHYEVVGNQLKRIPFKFPELEIQKELKTIKDIEMLEYKDILIKEYDCYPTLKAKMVE